MINHIKLIGKPTEGYRAIKISIQSLIRRSDGRFILTEVNDTEQIIKYHISQIPAVKVLDQIIIFDSDPTSGLLLLSDIITSPKSVNGCRSCSNLCCKKVKQIPITTDDIAKG